MSNQRSVATKQKIRTVCGMLKSKTSAIKALLEERAKDKKREEARLKNRPLS